MDIEIKSKLEPQSGDGILTYTAGVGWHEKESKAEVHGVLKAAYYNLTDDLCRWTGE